MSKPWKLALHILDEMNKVIAAGRDEVAESAPRMGMMQIDPDKIRDVIGKGGATIRSLCDEHNSTIDITDDGAVKIYSEDTDGLNSAMEAIKRDCCRSRARHYLRG